MLQWLGQINVSMRPNEAKTQYIFHYTPKSGIFRGEMFQYQIVITDMRSMPTVHLVNKAQLSVRHPNIYSNTVVCLGSFKWNYKAATMLAALFEHLKNIAEEPNFDDPTKIC